MVSQVGVHLFEARPAAVFVLNRVLFSFEDALGFPQETGTVGGVSAFRGRSTIVARSFVLRLIGPGSPVICPILPHLEEVRATAEENLFRPSMGFSKNQGLVAISKDLMDKRVQDVSSNEHGGRVAKAEEQSCHIAEDPVR